MFLDGIVSTVFNNAKQHINVYGDDVEVDYRGYEVTVENFLRVLTGRVNASVPRSKKLLTDDRSNILIYMTGHGGDGFLKFQDAEEISNHELGDALEQMWQKLRYNELMFVIETCQAASMFRTFYSPNIVATSSSSVSEDSLSHHMDNAIGVHIIDRWTYYALEFLEKVTPGSKVTLQDFFSSFDPALVQSSPQVRADLFRRKLDKTLITDFFGSVRNIELLNITSERMLNGKKEEREGGKETEGYAISMPPATMPLGYSLLLPQSDVRTKAADSKSILLLTAVGMFMTFITMATTFGMYRLIAHL